MGTAIVLILVVVCLLLLHRSGKRHGRSSLNKTDDSPSSTETNAPPVGFRDYIGEAESFVHAPLPLRDLLDKNRTDTLERLEKIAFGGGTMVRKAVVYALGQIGDESSLFYLRAVVLGDPASGVREAARASIAAIERAPAAGGYSEEDRCKIIHGVYRPFS